MNLNEKFTLSRRLTFRFNAAWSHLDESEDVGTARALTVKPFGKEDPHGEAKRTLSVMLIHTQADEEAVREAIAETLQYSCRCEHDCCGHWQTSVSRVRRLRGGMWAVMQSSYRNV
jgi:hypothetical protein